MQLKPFELQDVASNVEYTIFWCDGLNAPHLCLAVIQRCHLYTTFQNDAMLLQNTVYNAIQETDYHGMNIKIPLYTEYIHKHQQKEYGGTIRLENHLHLVRNSETITK